MTQSSMHLPPLRQGRRARHTEAVGTGRSRAVTPPLRDHETVSEEWLRPLLVGSTRVSPGLCRAPCGALSALRLRSPSACRVPGCDSGCLRRVHLPRDPPARRPSLPVNLSPSKLVHGAKETGTRGCPATQRDRRAPHGWGGPCVETRSGGGPSDPVGVQSRPSAASDS